MRERSPRYAFWAGQLATATLVGGYALSVVLGGVTVITAHVPLAEMFGYVTTLRSLTQGRATPNVTPSHYEEVPANIATEVIAKAAR